MLTVKIKPSKFLLLLFSMLHLGAIVILLQSTLTGLSKLIGITLCILGFCYYLGNNYGIYLFNVITQVWHTKEGKWLVLTNNGKLYEARLLGDSYISSYLLILNFKLLNAGKTLSALLVFDAYNKDELRRLKVALQMRGKVFN